MTPPQQVVYRRRDSPVITQKAQLIYKLFLLENARNTLEQQLLNLTNEAYEEVQGFLNTSFVFKKPCVFSDLAKALDAKCQAVDKLSALLKDLAAEPLVNVKNEAITHQLKPLRDKGVLMTDVLKFGPMLKNSIAKAVQVLGAAVSLQVSQRAAAVQQDDMMCGTSSSYNSAVATASPSPRWKADVREHAVFEESRPPDAGILPPAIIQSPKINTPERPPKLLTPIQAVLPEISNPKPMKTTPLISWGCENDVQVQHQKQTSSQLLHFLRAKAKNMGALEVTVMEWSKSTSSSPQSMSPAIKTQSYQLRRVTGDPMDAVSPKTLRADIENQTPIFRVKRLESNGSLTYTCVIATKTELWDFGDIFTEAGQGDSEAGVLENNSRNVAAEVENSPVNIQWKTQNVRRTEPEREGNFKGETTAEISGITVPEFQIRRFEEAEVVVSHIVSPGDFYVQHADCTARLQALVTDSWKATRSYAEQNRIPDIGTQVMGWFPRQEQWCRAQVTKICGVSGDNNATDGGETSIKVEVRRLDHGDFACLSLQKMKEMTPEMAALPLQAVQVSLANVTPATGRDWSEEAVGWFQAMVHNRTLYARLYPQGPKVTVELFLEKGKLGAMRRGASLSLRLAQNGHAKHNKLKNGSLMKRSTFQLQMKKQDSEWEKYLISYYTQSKK